MRVLSSSLISVTLRGKKHGVEVDIGSLSVMERVDVVSRTAMLACWTSVSASVYLFTGE